MSRLKKLSLNQILEILDNDKLFDSCYFENINFYDILSSINKAKFVNCSFKNCKFAKSKISNVTFIKTDFDKCSFYKSKLTYVLFEECGFISCDLSSANMKNCIFNSIKFYVVYFINSKIKSCKFKNNEFYQLAQFDKSTLSKNIFICCDIKGGKLLYENTVFIDNNYKKSNIRPIMHIDERMLYILTKYKKNKNNDEIK